MENFAQDPLAISSGNVCEILHSFPLPNPSDQAGASPTDSGDIPCAFPFSIPFDQAGVLLTDLGEIRHDLPFPNPFDQAGVSSIDLGKIPRDLPFRNPFHQAGVSSIDLGKIPRALPFPNPFHQEGASSIDLGKIPRAMPFPNPFDQAGASSTDLVEIQHALPFSNPFDNAGALSTELGEIPHALPFPNPFDQAGASSTDLLSLESWEKAIDDSVVQLEESCPFFPLSKILKATNNFDDALVVGTGGFGKVYKGFIDDGATTTSVAMKRLNAESKQGAEEFWTEVKLLSKLRHTHLVSLIGCCNEYQEMILIYEYIAFLCGRPPVDARLEEEQISLILWAKMYIKKGKLDQIIDPSLNGGTTPRSLKYFAELADKCLHTQPNGRPTMSEVVEILEIALALQERKERSQGTILKAFQGIKLVPKAMNRWWREGKGNDGGPILDDLDRFLILDDLNQLGYRRFSLKEIRAATDYFNLPIGFDAWFRLYKGCMVGGTQVAIKRYESRSELNMTERVKAEIRVQSLSRHPNIVPLIGFCFEKHESILVYEYMVNGTLRSHLSRTNNDPLLWKKRLDICIGIARGLKYLHTNVELQFIHRCIKPSNIFLDDEWVAKLSVFELAKPLRTSIASEDLETVVRSTDGDGYLDPEYFIYGNLTKKSDVYLFAFLLLEVLCAQGPYAPAPDTDELLISRFYRCIKRGTIDEVIDPYLIGKIAPECLKHYVNTAISCLVKELIRRPSTDDLLGSLQSALQLQDAWEKSVEIGDVPHSYNDVISVDSEFTIGGQSFLVSDLLRQRELGWGPIT
ncbi:hypothetical protein Vadar_017972 [Vaccinium darrowii]|uniref:Uncharacterized protein n=1 Tax=Vaccinium darrowii TaxID=229202 RepID=A0ACB7YWR3_9ERIC|nr:hypothetical protein Vadar_017972 [Vaccinium darrowii]